jgi:hypothetical protein
MKNISLVNVLAAQIRRKSGVSRSESMRTAWRVIRMSPSAEIITFKKIKTNEVTTRVISRRWFDYKAPSSGQSTLKEGQFPFADLCAYAVGEANCIRSTYYSQIIK